MLKQSLIWTCLPNGTTADGQSLRLSVLVSPRLTSDPADGEVYLDTYEDFRDWPATLDRATFIVHYGAGSIAIASDELTGKNRVDTSIGRADSEVWRALFSEPSKVFVAGFTFKDMSGKYVLSYNTREIHSLIRDLYTKLAMSAGDQLPKVSALLDDPDWRTVIDAVAENDRLSIDEKTRLRNPSKQLQLLMDGHQSKNPYAGRLARFQLFHTPPSTPEVQKYKVDPSGPVKPGDPREKAAWRTYRRTKLPDKAEFAKQIDFHQIVAAMNQYPTLLRRLGLVTDLLIDPKAFTPAADRPLWVEAVLPPGSPKVTRTPDASPRTRAVFSKKAFQALPRPSPKPGDYRVKDGLVEINPDQWDLLQTDVDGAGLKLMNFARSLHGMTTSHPYLSAQDKRLDPTTRHEKETGAPALRNAGLMLVHLNRREMLKNAFDRSKKLDEPVEKIHGGLPATSPDLYAEDLVRGYRIDIWDGKTGQWRSLCHRKAKYALNGGAVEVDVPSEEGTVRLAATKSADPASNPDLVYLHEALVSWTGWSLCVPPPGRTIDKDDKPADADAEVPPGLHMALQFEAVDGSLPRLRYGRMYWIRARVTDLAGNSLAPQKDDFGPEHPDTNAKAYLRYEPIAPPALALVKPEGGDVEAPAEGESMGRVAIRTFNETFDDPTPSGQSARRFAVPTRTTAKEAEHHSMLDVAGKVDAAAYDMLINMDEPLKEVIVKAAGPLTGPDGAESTYAVFEEDGKLPYLPEPLAGVIGARIFDLPGYSDTAIIPIPLYLDGDKWPSARPFQVRILEKPGDPPRYVNSDHTLYIPLPKAATATLRLSVMPADERVIEMMGVWNWLGDSDKAALKWMALRGQHWMLTPWRNVELVHAVQKPLIAPTLEEIRISRGLSKTFAHPRFVAKVSLKSTDHIDLQAEWNEPNDAGGAKGGNRARSDHAFSVKITDPRSYAGEPEHEIVKEDLIAVGREKGLPKAHEFHDTRYRRIEYRLEATTRFREYMPPEVLTETVGGETKLTDKRIKVVGPPVVCWIPNSSPPPAPEVLYVVPTFGWTRDEQAGRKSSWRRGGGLRVYLDRPWCVSGYGEMLGVLLPPTGFTADPNTDPSDQPLKSFVTQWGNDPIWLSPFVNGVAPKPANFPLRRTQADPAGKWLPTLEPAPPPTEADQPPGPFTVSALSPPALKASGATVEVAPHDVFYDEQRQLWYCDIEVNAGSSYYPFIRLALARYQPVSVYGAHLSNAVLADFMQLVPDRWLNVTQTGDPRVRRVAVFGTAFTDSSGSAEARVAPSRVITVLDKTVVEEPADVARTSVVEIWVEELNPALGEDFGWERVADAVVRRDIKIEKRPSRQDKTVSPLDQARALDLFKHRDYRTLLREDLLGLVVFQPTLWEGTVTLPTVPAEGATYRLVIAEYEEYLVDDPSTYDRTPSKKDRRLVFVEHVRLG